MEPMRQKKTLNERNWKQMTEGGKGGPGEEDKGTTNERC